MKISHKDLLAVNAGLVYLSQKETDAWMKVSRNIKLVKPVLVSWEESNREIIDKYVSKDKDGKPVVDGETYDFGKNKGKADEDYKKLMEEEVNVSFIHIKSEELTKEGEIAQLDALSVEPLLDVVVVD